MKSGERIRMKIWCMIAMGFLVSLTVLAGEIDTLETFRKLAPSSVSVRTAINQRVIEYCEQETCDIVKSSASVPKQTVGDFMILYAYYASSDAAAEKGRGRTAQFRNASRDLIPGILERNKGRCSGGEIETASCVLRSMAREHRIRLYLLEIKEGHSTLEPLEHSKHLGVKRLRALWKQKTV